LSPGDDRPRLMRLGIRSLRVTYVPPRPSRPAISTACRTYVAGWHACVRRAFANVTRSLRALLPRFPT
jgi:hypothetical protein